MFTGWPFERLFQLPALSPRDLDEFGEKCVFRLWQGFVAGPQISGKQAMFDSGVLVFAERARLPQAGCELRGSHGVN